MRLHPLNGAAVLVVAAGLVAGLAQLPASEVTHPSVAVSGTRSVICPTTDPALAPTTVRAVSETAVSATVLGGATTTGATSLALLAPAAPVLVTSGQTLGAVASADVGTTTQATACTSAATEGWWSGVWSSATQRSVLVLTNPDDTEADVDLTFFGPDGRITAAGSRGLRVLSGATRTVALEPLVSSTVPLSVQLSATQGRVQAVLRSEGDLGRDWQVSQTAPALDGVLTGIPAGDGARTLTIVNPGERRASVALQILGPRGPFAPAGSERVDVNADSSTTVDLTKAIGGDAVGVRLTSTQPVTAAVQAVAGGDIALVGSEAAIDSGALMPVSAGQSVVVSNAGDDAEVRVTPLAADGTAGETLTTTVVAGQAIVVPMTADGSVRIETAAQQVRAAIVVQSGGAAVIPVGAGGSADVSVTAVFDPSLR